MKCLGCYKEVKESYCPVCSKMLFDKRKIPSILNFDAPGDNNFLNFEKQYRQLSISGVQLKYSLQIVENDLSLTESKGQYILKPIPPARHLVNIEHVPENEHLTMQIAKRVFGINTAPNSLIMFRDGQQAYITRRFDVKPDGSKYQQEDFAQITGRTKYTHGVAYKYDGYYEETGLLIKKFVAAALPALEKFFQLVVYNYVISNGDAHLKNFSLLRHDDREYQLSPAYDLLSTVIHNPLEADTALDLYAGDIDSDYYSAYGSYGRPNFLELAKKLGLVEKRAERIIDAFIKQQNEVYNLIEQSFLPEDIRKLYVDNVKDKIKRLSAQ